MQFKCYKIVWFLELFFEENENMQNDKTDDFTGKSVVILSK